MAARRKRATVQRGAGIRAARMKAAGIRAHNTRLFGAVASRNTFSRMAYSKSRSMGHAEARMTRLRRKVRATNPRLAARRREGHSLMQINAGRVGRMLRANPQLVSRRPARMYKRDSRGRFARR